MLPSRYCILISFLLLSRLSCSQTTFQAGWSFEGNTNGSSSNGLVVADGMRTTGVNVASLSTVAYSAGQVGLAVSIQNWSTALCNNTEYVEFTVTPSAGAQITMTSLSFYFARSAQGPQQLSVRSSADGFSTDLFSQSVTLAYQAATISLVSPGFINQSGPVTFRIYACNPTAGGGTLKLDQVLINGAVLPVELLYFKGQVVNDRVELAWATVWERNAEQFVVERSRDLREFGTIGTVAANGTTDQIQRYTFTDTFPDGGTTYYRLKQVDFGGTSTYSKPVAIILDDQIPALALLGNPVEERVIRLAARNLANATFVLVSVAGQYIPLSAQWLSDGTVKLLLPLNITTGSYWLQASYNSFRSANHIIIH